jgi:gas vesicle structural protein
MRRHSLCDVLDRVLDQGAVASGEITLSLAGIDLVYLNLKLLLASSARMLAEQTKHDLPHLPSPRGLGR